MLEKPYRFIESNWREAWWKVFFAQMYRNHTQGDKLSALCTPLGVEFMAFSLNSPRFQKADLIAVHLSRLSFASLTV